MSTSDDQNSPPPSAVDASRRASRRRLGMALVALGLLGFLPSLAVAVLVDGWRTLAAFGALGFWLVWFSGKTLLKAYR